MVRRISPEHKQVQRSIWLSNYRHDIRDWVHRKKRGITREWRKYMREQERFNAYLERKLDRDHHRSIFHPHL